MACDRFCQKHDALQKIKTDLSNRFGEDRESTRPKVPYNWGEICQRFCQTDPTANSEFAGWIIESYLYGGITFWEDLGKVNDALKKYFWLRQNKRLDKKATDTKYGSFPIDETDIYNFCGLKGCDPHQTNLLVNWQRKYKSLGLDTLLKVHESDLSRFANKQAEEIDETDAEKLYDDDDVLVIHPLTKKGAIYYGQGTQWCTAATRSDNLFERYNQNGPLIILLPHRPAYKQEKYQLFGAEQQYMNEKDEPVKVTMLVKRFPQLFTLTTGLFDGHLAIMKFKYDQQIEQVTYDGLNFGRLSRNPEFVGMFFLHLYDADYWTIDHQIDTNNQIETTYTLRIVSDWNPHLEQVLQEGPENITLLITKDLQMPENLSQVKHLKYLGRRISPTWWTSWQKLASLSINLEPTVPSFLKHAISPKPTLPNLQSLTLTIRTAQPISLPVTVPALTELNILNISGAMRRTNIDHVLNDYPNLTSLDIHRLTVSQSGLDKCPKLQKLTLDPDQTIEIPSTLQELHWRSTTVPLPDNLKNVTVLEITGHYQHRLPNLQNIIEFFWDMELNLLPTPDQLPKLEKLHLLVYELSESDLLRERDLPSYPNLTCLTTTLLFKPTNLPKLTLLELYIQDPVYIPMIETLIPKYVELAPHLKQVMFGGIATANRTPMSASLSYLKSKNIQVYRTSVDIPIISDISDISEPERETDESAVEAPVETGESADETTVT